MFIADYVMRIAYNTNVSSEALVVSLILLHRLCGLHKNFPVNALSIHRTVLASIFASAKFVDDNVVRADHFAAAGGITKKELAGLELKFVFLIGFSLSVSEQGAYTARSLSYAHSLLDLSPSCLVRMGRRREAPCGIEPDEPHPPVDLPDQRTCL